MDELKNILIIFLLVVWSTRTHSQLSNDVNSYVNDFPDVPQRHKHHLHHRKSDPKAKETGLWGVLDPNAPRKGHKHAPSCLLIQFKASVVLPIQGWDGTVRNKTINIPQDAKSHGSCGNSTQHITFVWNNTHDSGKLVKTAQLTMVFSLVNNTRTKETDVYLTDMWSTIALFLDADGVNIIDSSLPSQSINMDIKQARLWKVPVRFAYSCPIRTEIKVRATTLPLIQRDDSDQVLIVDPVYNEEAFLVFEDLRAEAFRKARFARTFTHLKWDCRWTSWAYAYMPAVVVITLGVTVMMVTIMFFFRHYLGCADIVLDPDEEDEKIIGRPRKRSGKSEASRNKKWRKQ